jgi:NlpC/P60 family putative phage cell wall peptidase
MSDIVRKPRRPGIRRLRAQRALVAEAARGWLGTPYQHQASLRGVGADCLGLLRGVWREVIGDEPEAFRPYSPSWAEVSCEDLLENAARRHLLMAGEGARIAAGMVILFRWRPHLPAKHCAIATGPERFIHAHDGASVAEVTLVPGWRRRIAGLFDFPVRST